ncbi:hypothetical protein F8388_020883 [Cannabis sativa]|uniref:Uncharacterized protein n=1 Tax=Cannabis sativa TaxID=3483 RepID=A0A7J6FKC3_CANSA|nr:hypothetical protein F8388_020883 [Cannabis sativa]
MDSSREAFKVVAMNNKIKGTIRKEMISRRQLVREEEDVDDLAEAFIKNFHNSLNMEREELLKRLHERKNRRVISVVNDANCLVKLALIKVVASFTDDPTA